MRWRGGWRGRWSEAEGRGRGVILRSSGRLDLIWMGMLVEDAMAKFSSWRLLLNKSKECQISMRWRAVLHLVNELMTILWYDKELSRSSAVSSNEGWQIPTIYHLLGIMSIPFPAYNIQILPNFHNA